MGRLLLLACVGCGFSAEAPRDVDAGSDGGGRSFAITLSVSTVEEHGSFSAHVVALDGSGAVDSSYQGQPGFSTNWGDLTVQQGPRFLAGAADVMLSLNRETSGTTLAYVTVSDGLDAGTSNGLKVTAPAWQVLDAAPVFEPRPTSWDALISEPRWLRKGGVDYLFYLGAVQGSSTGTRGLATSTDGVTWNRNDQPVFAAGTSGWDAGHQPFYFHVALDGDTLVAAYAASANPFGVARSSDGVTWTRSAMGWLPARSPACGIQYLMTSFYVVDGSYQVAFAEEGEPCVVTSSDAGQTFTDLSPLAGMPQTAGFPYVMQVLKEGSVYRIWYEEVSDTTLYATSSDGVTWVPSPSPPIPYNLQSVVWNEVEARYQAMILAGPAPGGFERVVRP